jgi:hypothetical protein
MMPLNPFTYSVNEHGCTIEHGIFAPTTLDQGRCCGRNPMVYKTGGLHFFCPRCNRHYDPAGRQRSNWAFKAMPDGNFEQFRPMSMDEAKAISIEWKVSHG